MPVPSLTSDMNVPAMPKLEELVSRGREPNPVNVAGYGRESTHKGYLHWILDAETWDRGGEVLARLVAAAGGPHLGRVSGIYTEWEQPWGLRQRIDLVARFETDGRPMAVPIELKTDAPPGGKKQDQLERLNTGEDPGRATPARLLLALGSASVQDMQLGGFIRLGPSQVVDALAPVTRGAPPLRRSGRP